MRKSEIRMTRARGRIGACGGSSSRVASVCVVGQSARQPVDHVARRDRRGQAQRRRPLAAANEHVGERQPQGHAAGQLVVGGERRAEGHGGRTIHPEEIVVRGLPFTLAHIELIAARRAAPVDAMRRLARCKWPILPKRLADARALAAMNAIGEARRDLMRARHQPRHPAREISRRSAICGLALCRIVGARGDVSKHRHLSPSEGRAERRLVTRSAPRASEPRRKRSSRGARRN